MILLVSLVFVKLWNHFEHSIRTSFNYRNCFHKKSSTSLQKNSVWPIWEAFKQALNTTNYSIFQVHYKLQTKNKQTSCHTLA